MQPQVVVGIEVVKEFLRFYGLNCQASRTPHKARRQLGGFARYSLSLSRVWGSSFWMYALVSAWGEGRFRVWGLMEIDR